LELIEGHRDRGLIVTSHALSRECKRVLIFGYLTEELDDGICLFSEKVIKKHCWYLIQGEAECEIVLFDITNFLNQS